VSPTNWATTSIQSGVNIYSVFKYLNSVSSQVFKTGKGETVQETHTFVAEENDYYEVLIRADTGVTVNITISVVGNDYATDEVTNGSIKLVTSGGVYDALYGDVLLDDAKKYSSIVIVSNSRKHAVYPLTKGRIRVVFSSTSSTFKYAFKWLDNPNTTTLNTGPYYGDTGWITNGYADLTFDLRASYLVLTVAKVNNGNISAAEMDAAIAACTLNVTKVGEGDVKMVSAKNALISAHRGTFYTGLPENSLPSFRLAGRLGYDFIECDVRVTSDGKFVIMHDTSINRTCKTSSYGNISGTVNVADTTLSALRSNYVLAADDPACRLPIPTLDEYLLAVKQTGSMAMVELEPMTNAQVQEVYDRCVSVMGKGRFCFNSGQYGELDYVRSIDSDVDLLYQTDPIINTVSTIDGSTRNHPHNIWYSNYQGNYGTFTSAVVETYHSAGMRVGAWTVPADKYSAMCEMGVDIVNTNDIAPSLSDAPVERRYFDHLHRDVFFKTNGTTGTTGISLTAGQYIDFRSWSHDLGILLLRLFATGNYTITTNTQTLSSSTTNTYAAFSQTVNDSAAAWHEIRTLYRTYCELTSGATKTPFVRITAVGATTIHAIELAETEVK
jgi:glycerophosphoryl diester phosphodiesterase